MVIISGVPIFRIFTVLLAVPRRYFCCCFVCLSSVLFNFLNVLILTVLFVQLFNSVKVTELPFVCERAAYSAYHLLFRCL